MDPLARAVGIGAALPKYLVVFPVLQDEAAVGFLELDTINSESDAAVLIQILKAGDNNLLRSISRVLTIGFAIGLRWRTGQRSACGIEVDVV